MSWAERKYFKAMALGRYELAEMFMEIVQIERLQKKLEACDD